MQGSFLETEKKSSDPHGLQSEHNKHVPDDRELFIHVAGLFTGIIKYGFIPRQMRDTAIVSIMKDEKGDRHDPDNSRGIVLSSIVGRYWRTFY